MAEEDAGTPRRDPSGKTRTPHSDVGKTRTPHSDVGNNFRHKHFYRQTLLHTDAFYTQAGHAHVRKGSRDKRDDLESQIYFSFWRSNLISCERVAWDNLKSQFYFSF